MKHFVASATTDTFVLSGLSIASALTVTELHDALGSPDRIVSGGHPAPSGYRNNQIHIYDKFGIYLNEHHFTHLLCSVTFVLDLDFSPFPPAQPFSGTVAIGDLVVSQPFSECDIAQTGLPFQKELGLWTLTGDSPNWIGLESKGKIVHSVSVSVPHDPHDDSHRPE